MTNFSVSRVRLPILTTDAVLVVLRTFCVAVLVFAISTLAVAQTTSATLSGTVMDHSGAVVTEARIEVTNSDTGVKVSTLSNKSGVYVVTGLVPGRYRMAVTKEGFRSVVVTDVTLDVQDVVSRNFNLDVGALSETITVTADQMNINTADASVSTVVDQSYVQNMPLNGRSFQDLILLTPGVVTTSPQSGEANGQKGEFSVNGQRTESNYYTVDGVSANVGSAPGVGLTIGSGASGSIAGATALGTTQALVSVDDLQEFRVQSSTYSAEYGRNPGGQFAFETKSGTNQWHGTAFDYLRNDVFDAADYFTDYLRAITPGLAKAALRQNDFGGTLGGPLSIPHAYNGKDKTFFFVSYEGLRLLQPQPASTNYVPDTQLRTTPGALGQALNAWPVQNGPEVLAGGNPTGIAEYIANWSNPSSLDSTSIRFDQMVKDKFRFFFRFSDTGSSSTVRGSGLLAPSLRTISANTMRTYTGGVNTILAGHWSNEFRLNYSSNGTNFSDVLDNMGGATPVNLQQLAGLGPGSTADVTLFLGGHIAALDMQQVYSTQKQWNLTDSLSWLVGRHQMKFGADFRRLTPFVAPNQLAEYLYLSQTAITQNCAGNAPGNCASLVPVNATAPAYPLFKNFSAFAQDEWKATSRLNLSFGLRWEVNPPPGVTQGPLPRTADITNANAETASLLPPGTPLWKTTWFNFAPRLAAAYELHAKSGWETVIRGGGGVFFDTGQQRGTTGFGGPGYFTFTFDPPSALGPVPSAVIPTDCTPAAPCSEIEPFWPHLQLPYTLQWNASVEQALGNAQTFLVSYVGSHASRLLQQNIYQPVNNPILQPFAQFIVVQNGLTSDYQSLQAQFKRRLSQGLTALASYTLSHCIDYGSTDQLVGYQRGNCDFDVRHNFSGAFSYDLQNAGPQGIAGAVLHHWGLDSRFTARGAFPVTLNGDNGYTFNSGQFFNPATDQFFNPGLDLVPGKPLYLYGTTCAAFFNITGSNGQVLGCPGGRAINPDAFSAVSIPVDPNTFNPTRLGNAPRNFVRGFGAWQLDMAVRREFRIAERLRLQFRAEAFNIFNHPTFGNINASYCNPDPNSPDFTGSGCLFGQAGNTLAHALGVLSPLYQMGGPRSMQFALKFVF